MPPIRPELLDELLKDYQKPEDLLGDNGLLQHLTKALVERALDGELTHHLGFYEWVGLVNGFSRVATSWNEINFFDKGAAGSRTRLPGACRSGSYSHSRGLFLRAGA